MIKKKIAIAFVTQQSVDYYKNTGFFKDVSQYFDITVLKLPSFQIELEEIKEENLAKLDYGWVVDFLKYIKEKASLRFNDKRFQNKNHHLYAPYRNAKGTRHKIKFKLVNFLSYFFASKKGVKFIEKMMASRVTKSNFFNYTKSQLKSINPDLVYITHQTTSYTFGVSLVAKALKIPTVCFIYSWDNIVKGNKLVKADYYYVWSDYMKQEFLQYYADEVLASDIIVVGTPQFHHYSQLDTAISKEVFFKAYNIPKRDYYVCFSGNFTAIGQDDAAYLKDLAEAVERYNKVHKSQFHILLRANPADYNHDFTDVVNSFSDIITDVNPDWKTTKQPLPISENKISLSVLQATIQYSDAMVNVGSTMALDATLLNKRAYYIDYKIIGGSKKFRIEEIYKFIHFKSLKENNNPVEHIKKPSQYLSIFEEIQAKNHNRLELQKEWANKIVLHPIDKVSQRMLNGFKNITSY